MNGKVMAALLAVAMFTVATSSADARSRKHHTYKHRAQHMRVVAVPASSCVPDNNGRTVCSGAATQQIAERRAVDLYARGDRRERVASYDGGRIVAHPAGCPGRAFCGCGVSVRVFGKPVRNLYLAANWLKYPRASPSSGMVAARHGHVMYIESMDANGNAVVYDPNSGGHQTRVHTRSLRGYTVVNPHGARLALR